MTQLRRAEVRGFTNADSCVAYLPDNYKIVSVQVDTEMRPKFDGSNYLLITIEGSDVAGWTLDGYVIPRLASGMYFAKELAHEVEDTPRN